MQAKSQRVGKRCMRLWHAAELGQLLGEHGHVQGHSETEAHLTPIAVRAPAKVLVVAVGVRADPVSFPALPYWAACAAAAATITACAFC